VFVDGCFWHSCPQHATFPRANAEFWRQKLAENVRRDHDTNERLQALGWVVIRVWEHEIERDAVAVARRISRKVVRRSADIGSPNGKRFPED